MVRFVRKACVAAILAATPVVLLAQDRQLAPVFDRTAVPASDRGMASMPGQIEVPAKPVGTVEERLGRLERMVENQALLDMLMAVESLQTDTQSIRGEMEELQHSLESMKLRQRDLYTDIDRRIRDVETKAATVAPIAAPSLGQPTSPASVAAPSPVVAIAPMAAEPGDPALERQEYQAAFDALKQGQYDNAIVAFQGFLSRYPAGDYSGNAQYWLGEANYVTRHFDVAESEFKKVLALHADSQKVPDAMLKLGYTYYELSNWESARKTLNDVVNRYAGTTVARLAENRLQKMRLEGR